MIGKFNSFSIRRKIKEHDDIECQKISDTMLLNFNPALKLYNNIRFNALSKTVLVIGCIGFLLNISTTMIYSQLAMFLKYELKASAFQAGLMDGIVEFISYTIRVFSGSFSDYLLQRKPIFLIGCFIVLCVKPLFITAHSTFTIFLAQSLDRVGNGLQASPRDALVCDVTLNTQRGQAFGFIRSFRTVGSFLGALFAIGIMLLTSNNFKSVFVCAIIPCIIALFLLATQICEKKTTSSTKKTRMSLTHFKCLKKPLWKIIILAGLFELAHFGEALLNWRASDYLPTEWVGLTLVLMNIGQLLSAYPLGLLSDRFNRYTFLKICFCIMLMSNFCLMLAPTSSFFLVVIFLWGVQMSLSQTLFLSLISEAVDEKLRGTAVGIFYFVIGVSYMIASTISSLIWDHWGYLYSFAYSIAFCLLSLIVLNILFPRSKNTFFAKSN